MGAWNSIHSKLNELSKESDDQDYEYSTPERALRQKRLVNIDPRSPSENIDRTPIVISGTPSIASRALGKTRVAPEKSGPQDPRSPSAEFARTPISLLPQKFASSESDTPVKGFTASKDTMKSENVCHSSQSSTAEQLCKALELVQSSSSNASESSSDYQEGSIILTDGSLEDSVDTAPLLMATQDLSISESRMEKSKTNTTTAKDSDKESHSEQAKKLKCRQINRILGQTSSTPVKPRSPLSHVENSPRISSKSKKSTPAPGINSSLSSISVDKENACH